jgi:hypothetical protein
MTEKRDLKRRVRERQARTGESYVTALRQVLSQRESSVPVVELIDLTDIAAALGIKCRTVMAPSTVGRVDPTAMLTQLRDALLTTLNDPDLALMRAVVIAGEQLKPELEPVLDRRFLARLRAGIGGISQNGRTLALSTAGRTAAELVVFALWLMPLKYIDRAPTLMVAPSDALSELFGFDVAELFLGLVR